MKKIGLVTLYNSDNYGAMLQAYALQQAIISCDAECEIVSHNRFGVVEKKKVSKNSKYKKLVETTGLFIKNPTVVRYALAKLSKKKSAVLKRNAVKCAEFRRKYFPNKTKVFYYDADQIRRDVPECDAFICGSDQIWSPERVSNAGPFFLDFVPKGKHKIAYAPSLGVGSIPAEMAPQYKEWVENFNALSVREKQGCDAIFEASGRRPEQTLDPTFLISKEDWEKIACTDYPEKPYVFCYFLRKNNLVKARRFINSVAKKNGLAVYVLPGNQYLLDKKWATVSDAGPDTFLTMIKNAHTVITDSFHGTALSINMEKPFFVFNSEKESKETSRFSRIESILNLFEMKDRVFGVSTKEIEEHEIDYSNVRILLQSERNKSMEFLRNAIAEVEESPKQRRVTPEYLVSHESCTGCAACANACPKHVLEMKQQEGGFWYPEIVNENQCIQCGRCVQVCGIRNPHKLVDYAPEYFAVYAKNDEFRRAGTSGNAFGLLANRVLAENGVVYGASFDEQYYMLSAMSTEQVALEKLQKSKYLESAMLDVHQRMRQNLTEGKTVMFCGTPCQVEGLRKYFGEHERLLLCDFLCHGVPSLSNYQSYVQMLEKKYKSKLTHIDFRSKLLGWKPYVVKAAFENGKVYKRSQFDDPFIVDFLSNKHLKKCCYSCQRAETSCADITVGDYWQNDKSHKIPNDNKGISIVAIRSEKGKRWFDSCVASENISATLLQTADVDETFSSKIKKTSKDSNHIMSPYPKLYKKGVKGKLNALRYRIKLGR